MAKENKIDQTKEKVKKNSDYTAEDIYVLEGLEPVRQRPGMYIGSTGIDGLHHLIYECVDNSIDEAMAGYCDLIEVILQKDGSVKCADNGRGIPVETHKKTGKSALETVMTTLHAGGKFGSGAYKVSGGLHGVGVSVVCALSKYMKSEICRDGFIWTQEFAKGKPISKVKKGGGCKHTGTSQTFIPDETIFKTGIIFDKKKVLRHLRQQAYLTPGVRINIRDEREDPLFDYNFYFEGGIKSYVKYLLGETEQKHENIFYCKNEKENVLVEAALVYGKEEIECLEESFANNINTGEGGMHLTGFRTALTRVINDYARKNSYLKEKEENLTGNDVREGLVAVVSIKIKEPQFEGQTKAKLGNTEAKTAVEAVFSDAFGAFLEKNPTDARGIIESCMLSARARMAAKAARTTVLRKGVLDGLALPGKLADCSSKAPEDSELYLVEGDSAGGCFTGETKIDLLDGRKISFKKLVKENEKGKQNYCFSIQEDGSVGIGLIRNVWKTKSNTEVIRVIFDNNKEILCTPDHKFMLRDGSYKEALELSKEDSLMPLRRKIAQKGGKITIDGYDMTFCPQKQQWIFTHLLGDKYNLAKKRYFKNGNSVIHHIDYNKLNNSPTNLQRMDKMEHLYFHATVARDNLSKPETLKKIREAHQKKEYRTKISQIMSTSEMKKILSQRAKKQWENEDYKKYMTRRFLDFYENNPDYMAKNNKLLNNEQKKYWANTDNRLKQAERVRKYFENHHKHRTEHSQRAQEQWQDKSLLQWRSETTKNQWTETFRQKRKIAYNKTYFSRSLCLLREVFDNSGIVSRDDYKEIRIQKKAKNALKYDTLLERFFENSESKLIEAVENYNHKIKKIEIVKQRRDVYDLEVEGTHNFALSAGVFVHNSSKMARDRRFQAILPLRGKVLNVERARLDKILANNEIKNLIIALGTAVAQDFDIDKLRYHRVILMSDADVDGSHIKTLLLTLFYRYFKEIIEKGYLYIAQPPLYKVQAGKRLEYAYTDEDKNEILLDFTKNKALKGKDTIEKTSKKKVEDDIGKDEAISLSEGVLSEDQTKKTGVNVQRYKGLGEMNPEELWETTMNPENRILLQVNIEDGKQADQMFDTLMGKEVLPRKKFIQAHAKKVKNLDI